MKLSTIRKFFLGTVAALALGGGGLAIAQIVSPTLVTSINSGDLFQDVPNGTSASTNVYASATQLRGWILGGNVLRVLEANEVKPGHGRP